MFRRKVYDELKAWKEELAPRYACLLEGARRVGKTTIAEDFARREYRSYIKIDFSDVSNAMLEIFAGIQDRDMFFLRLQTETGIKLYERGSVIIFDEVQLYPKARQAIKFLVKDGRYDYIETGSLISIRKNVKDILIPSEEHKISVYPMDYEEFLWATGGAMDILREGYRAKIAMGDSLNREQMRIFRLYMAVGGMPQAVEAFLRTKDFRKVDLVKREIISLYKDDLMKIDSSGRLSAIYEAVPLQLALKKRRFVLSSVMNRRMSAKDEELLLDLIESRLVLPCYNVSTPSLTMAQDRIPGDFKLYLSDIGLFTTMVFADASGNGRDIYRKLLSDKLPANLGHLYENAVAQTLVSYGRRLYFHSWRKAESTHNYEIDFLLVSSMKVIPLEVKSSATRNHLSMDAFCEKYSSIVSRRLLFSQKDVSKAQALELKPIYMLPLFLEELAEAESQLV